MSKKCKRPGCKKCCCPCCISFLRLISLGKIQLGLYYRNSLQYGSTLGGVVSLILGILMVSYSGMLLSAVFDGSGKVYEFYTKDITAPLNVTTVTNKQVIPKIKSIFMILTNVDTYDDDYCTSNIEFLFTFFSENLTEQSYSFDDLEIITTPGPKNTVICKIRLQYFYAFSPNSQLLMDGKSILYNAEKQAFNLNLSFSINAKLSTTQISNAIIYYNYSSFTQDTQQEEQGYLSLDTEYSEVTITFDLFNRTNDVTGLFSKYESNLFINDMQSYLCYGDQKQNYKIIFLVDNKIKVTIESPYNLFTTLSKIGGLLAFSKVFTAMIQAFHYKQLEKKLNRIKSQLDDDDDSQFDNAKYATLFSERKSFRINEENLSVSINNFTEAGNNFEELKLKDFFSFRIFVQMAQEINNQRITIQVQQEEINDLKQQLHQIAKKFD